MNLYKLFILYNSIYYMSSCYKISNNKYFHDPAIMNDGRTFTDYRSQTTLNNLIMENNNIKNNFEYKQFLIHNGSEIINLNTTYTINKVGIQK